MNSYLELIFVYNQDEFEENAKQNADLDFLERANYNKNNASPFGLALKLKEYTTEKIPFKNIIYHQDWMEANENIYTAKTSKTRLNEPSVFVVYPIIEYDEFETLSDLKNIPDAYAVWRTFYKHSNGAKRISNIVITSNNLDLNTETMRAINEVNNITIKQGSEHLLELYFDENIQGKTFDLRPQLPLKYIYKFEKITYYGVS